MPKPSSRIIKLPGGDAIKVTKYTKHATLRHWNSDKGKWGKPIKKTYHGGDKTLKPLDPNRRYH